MKKGRTAPGRGAAGKAGASKRPALPPLLPAPEELEDLAASNIPSLAAAWWVTHQVTEHVFSTVARTDSRTGDPLPQSLTELLSELNTATSTGCRPFPQDLLFDAALFAAEPFAQLLDHHRHRIIRTHAQLPFHRLREVDTRSLAWLARLPGRNVREKLSGRTHALGVKRDLTADTTENRLLRAFAKLVVHRATDRLAHAESYDRAAPDMDRVSKLAEVARLCDERLRRSEIPRISRPWRVYGRTTFCSVTRSTRASIAPGSGSAKPKMNSGAHGRRL